MKLAIVHYHLHHGGVSAVIAMTSRMLSRRGTKHVILIGSTPTPEMADLPWALVEGLNDAGNTNNEGLLRDLRLSAIEHLGHEPDLWHFHNHSLGKNPALCGVVSLLAEQRAAMLLHIHDLAEDGRPENVGSLTDLSRLYPTSGRIRYGFINTRDRDRFLSAGLAADHAHMLPNPVSSSPLPPAPSGPPLLLYPVRGIRRKNLGEFLLLTTLSPEGTRGAITRAPLNPDALLIHDAWRRVAHELKVPVTFDVVSKYAPEDGADSSFDAWLKHSTHLVTTSVSEGFGLVFPESVALGRFLVGRNLQHLTHDFAEKGLRFSGLYDRLLVPREWVDETAHREILTHGMHATWNAWGRTAPTMDDHGGPFDFGKLPEVIQMRVIRHAIQPESGAVIQVEIDNQIRPLSTWLAEVLSENNPASSPSLSDHFSPDFYLNKLMDMYHAILISPASSARFIDHGKILDAYLTRESFHILGAPAFVRHREAAIGAFKAVIFDIYGTLLSQSHGAVQTEPDVDAKLRSIFTDHGHHSPASPSTALHAAVIRHHAASAEEFPEVDLRDLWLEVLGLAPATDITCLVTEIESAWHPSTIIPGVSEALRQMHFLNIPLGVLSNAQCNTLLSLGDIASLLSPDLTILSYQHGIAKPSPRLFDLLAERLALRGISPRETLYIGNDPLHDIEPAAARGFQTALFTGHPLSHRHGFCHPDYEICDWMNCKLP